MGSKSTKSTSTTAANPIATTAYNRLLARSQQLSKQEYQPYTGERVAGFTPDQARAFEAIRDSQGVWQPYFDEASKYAKQGAQGTAGALEDFNSDNLQKYLNPATQGLVDATMANIRQANATQQNDLLGKAISSGASPFGGDRAGLAAAELARNQDLASNQTIAGLQSDAYNAAVSQFNAQNAARQQALQGDRSAAANAGTQFANLGTGAQGANLTDIGSLLTSGGLQQQNTQAGLDKTYEEWKNQQAFPYNNLSWLAGIVGGLGPLLGGTSQGETTSPGVTGGDILGLATSALGFLSDERVKEDIRPVGELDNGQTVYAYRYKGDPRMQIGLLAQEVAEDRPDAVMDMGGGILGVNYDKATRRAAGGIVLGQDDPGHFDPTTFNPLDINMLQVGGKGLSAPSLPQMGAQQGGDGINTESLTGFGKALKGAIDGLSSSSGSHAMGGGLGPIYKRGGIVAGYADGGSIYDTDDEPADAPWLASDDAGGIAPQLPDAAPMGAPMALAPTGGIVPPQSQPPSSRGLLFGESPNMPLVAAGAAMMASRSPRWGAALGEGILAGLTAYQSEKSRAKQLDGKPMVLNDGPTLRLFYPSDGRVIDTGVPNYAYQDKQKQNAPKVSLSPVYGTKNGKTVLLQPSDAGTLVESAIPEGVEISSGVDKIDLGTQWGLIDKRTGQVVGYQPKDVAGVEEQKALGKAQGEEIAAAPNKLIAAENFLSAIEKVEKDPNREWGTGKSAAFNWVPASPGFDFQEKVGQLKGKAFLDAYASLKGTGAISEAEGLKAEQAIGRLNTSQSEEAFLEALQDLKEVVQQGIERYRAKAGGASGEGGAMPSPKTRAEVEALPPGTKFLWNGKVVTRQ
jgi:hypothetical protein